MDLAIVIVSWNVRKLLRGCLMSIHQSLAYSASTGRGLDTGIWVVDNDSADGTAEMVRQQFPEVHLIANQENRGFAGGNNQALLAVSDQAPGAILLLNPDTVVRGKALEELESALRNLPKAGMTGARLAYGDGSFQHAAFRFPGLAQILLDLFPLPARLQETSLNGRYSRALYAPTSPPFAIDHPLGASMMIRREVLDTIGLMDESFYMYCEEIDWAMRIRSAGWEIYCVPSAEIVHFAGKSTAQVRAESFVNLWHSRYRLYRKHYSPGKVRLASWLVRLGMRYKLARPAASELHDAFRRVSELWHLV